MKIAKFLVLAGIACALLSNGIDMAEVEMTVQQTFNLESKPVSVNNVSSETAALKISSR